MTKKLYIFLVHSITNLGGAEIYVRNKSQFLKENGWNVIVYSFHKGNAKLQDLSQYNKYIRYELSFSPFVLRNKLYQLVLDDIIKQIEPNKYTNIYIESNDLVLSLWGELIAKKINAKHIVFNLQEDDKISSSGMLEFLDFKLNRRELFGIQKSSIIKLFQPYKSIEPLYDTQLTAYCCNCIENVPNKINIPQADFIIGSIGRIEKPYLKGAINDVINFAKQNFEHKISYIIIGGEIKGKKIQNEILKKFNNITNVNLLITGYIYPIPQTLINQIDVFLSSAGSAQATADMGKFTISYDASDVKPIGILNITTTNNTFRNNEPVIEGSTLLKKILLDKEYSSNTIHRKRHDYNFMEHLNRLNINTANTEYFNFNKYNSNRKDKFKSIMLTIFGIKGMEMIRKIRASL